MIAILWRVAVVVVFPPVFVLWVLATLWVAGIPAEIGSGFAVFVAFILTAILALFLAGTYEDSQP